MTDPTSALIIVTPEAVASAFNESVIESAPALLHDIGDPVARAAFLAALPGALRAVKAEADEIGRGVLSAPGHDLASRLMSAVADQAPDGSRLEPLTAGGLELKFATNDWWGWFRSIFDRVARSRFHPMLRPADFEPTPIPNACRIGMLGDWATGLYGAPVAAQTLVAGPRLDVLVHLGDVYYSGTAKETDERFLAGWPFGAAAVHRAVNSNHEMYSGGHAYFGRTLPRFGQASSYFALANDHWLLIGLDTGYVDHDVDAEQASWVGEMVRRAEGRRVILLSHHQMSSHFSPQGMRLAASLRPVLEDDRVVLWYWAHEHRGILYEPDPRFGGLLGRCAGHGGMPERRGKYDGLPVSIDAGHAVWRRFPGKSGAPGGIVLDGENPHIPGHERTYAPHGYVMLELADAHLAETMCLPGGEVVYRGEPF